jgi:hypothetical protein
MRNLSLASKAVLQNKPLGELSRNARQQVGGGLALKKCRQKRLKKNDFRNKMF